MDCIWQTESSCSLWQRMLDGSNNEKAANAQQHVQMVTAASQIASAPTEKQPVPLQQAVVMSDSERTPATSTGTNVERSESADKSLQPPGEAEVMEITAAESQIEGATLVHSSEEEGRGHVNSSQEKVQEVTSDVRSLESLGEGEPMQVKATAAESGNEGTSAVKSSDNKSQERDVKVDSTQDCVQEVTPDGGKTSTSDSCEKEPMEVLATAAESGNESVSVVNSSENKTKDESTAVGPNSHRAKVPGADIHQDSNAKGKDSANDSELRKSNPADINSEKDGTAKTSSDSTKEPESRDKGIEDQVPSSYLDGAKDCSSTADLRKSNSVDASSEEKDVAKLSSDDFKEPESIADQSVDTSVKAGGVDAPSTSLDTKKVDSSKKTTVDGVPSEDQANIQDVRTNAAEGLQEQEEVSVDGKTSGVDEDDDVIPLDEPMEEKPAEVIDLTADDERSQTSKRSSHLPQGAEFLKPPDNPATAYQRFYREVYLGVQRENEELNYQDLKKAIKNMWRVLPNEERQVYTKQFDEAVQKYNEDLEVYAFEMKRLKRKKSNQHQTRHSYPTLPRGPDNAVVTNSVPVSRSGSLQGSTSHLVVPNFNTLTKQFSFHCNTGAKFSNHIYTY